VEALHDLLAKRYLVWWDQDIHSGLFRAEIERELGQAKCVIPVWCQASRDNQNVLDEAQFAKEKGVPLLPVRIEPTAFPIGFGGFHTVDLIGWKGDPEDERIQTLLRSVENTLLDRPWKTKVSDRTVTLPAFFRSVSSHETAVQPAAAVHALKLVGCEALLVSAYDIVNEDSEQRDQIVADLLSCQSAGSVVLLDSGNYEASRKKDKSWCAEQLHETLRTTPHDLALSFDDLDPPSDVESLVKAVVNSVKQEMKHTSSPVIPIVHAPRKSDGRTLVEIIPEAIKRVCKELRPDAVAIPERELGDGILTRARIVYAIRRSLNELGFYQPLHLLGTGNPLSIAVFSAVGADWFDGLEWCRTVADSDTGRLYHLQQYDFFGWQSEVAAESPIVKEAVLSKEIAYSGKVIFHNLDFFASWMKDLRTHLQSDKVERFLTDKLPLGKDSMQLLEKAVPEVFG